MTPYIMDSPPGARTIINGRERDDFAGCSYLGLGGHPELLRAAGDALLRYGIGPGTSRTGYGEHRIYLELEAAAARFFETEDAVYYSAGYLGSAALLQGLAGQYERVFMDAAAHYSVEDAAASIGAPLVTFADRDPHDLARRLQAHLKPGERPLVISDGVFPVTGAIAPADDYARVLERYDGASICLDDADVSGVIGERGHGSLEYLGVRQPRCYTAHTLSKAFGGHGGLVAGDASLTAALRQRSRVYAGASQAPLPAAAASTCALELVRSDPAIRRRLWTNVARAKAGLRALGWALPDTPVPILCLPARPGLDLGRLQAELFARDLCVLHVTHYSSMPAGGAIRIAICATHTDEQIDRLLAEIGRLAG